MAVAMVAMMAMMTAEPGFGAVCPLGVVCPMGHATMMPSTLARRGRKRNQGTQHQRKDFRQTLEHQTQPPEIRSLTNR
ncbi:hypothetical protein AJ87_34650 [Rhizobium yanglingense]|nr:hypothetical protein AJ87_34650 [Rhizobium yanglingense]